jgi:hypothetical protein
VAKLSRREFGSFVSAAAAGLAGGAVVLSGCGDGMAAMQQKHVCKSLNTCKGQGGCKTGDAGCAGKNSCKFKGGCATFEKHTCKGMNNCKNQGGCKTKNNGCSGANSCKGMGGCAVPVKDSMGK